MITYLQQTTFVRKYNSELAIKGYTNDSTSQSVHVAIILTAPQASARRNSILKTIDLNSMICAVCGQIASRSI